MKQVEEYTKSDGHSYVTLYKNGIGKEFRVCDLVWTNFVGEIPNGYDVAHIDGNKKNNRLDNLKLVSNGSDLS